MGKWRLNPGCAHSVSGGRDLVGGDEIEMPDHRMDAFKDKFTKVGEDDIAPLERENKLKLFKRGGGWYDVVDAKGKKLNDNALLLEDAQAMIGPEGDTKTEHLGAAALLAMGRRDLKRLIKSQNLDVDPKAFPDTNELREEVAEYMEIDLEAEAK